MDLLIVHPPRHQGTFSNESDRLETDAGNGQNVFLCLDLAEWDLNDAINFIVEKLQRDPWAPSPIVVASGPWPTPAEQSRLALAGAVLLEPPAGYLAVRDDEDRARCLINDLAKDPGVNSWLQDLQQMSNEQFHEQLEPFLREPAEKLSDEEKFRRLRSLNEDTDND